MGNYDPFNDLWVQFPDRVQHHANELIEGLEELYPDWEPTRTAETMILNTLNFVASHAGPESLSGAVDAALALARVDPNSRGVLHGISSNVPVPVLSRILDVVRAYGRLA